MESFLSKGNSGGADGRVQFPESQNATWQSDV